MTKCDYCQHVEMCGWQENVKRQEQECEFFDDGNKWIPVSERMPEVGSEVLVCFDFKGNRSVYISNFYSDGEFHGLDDEYLTSEGRKYRKAIAWMPLPKPYKAKSEDQKEKYNCSTCIHHKPDNPYCECCFDLDKYEKYRNK